MTRRGAALTAAVMGFVLSACGSPTGTGVSADTDGPPPEDTDVDLPEVCVAEIREFLVAVEPIVADMDFASPSEEDLEQLGPASDAFDPDLCPDVSVDEARAAWLAIAAESAPGAAPYVEYIYAD